ncbi:hypothetical protein BRAS3843_1100090 [Bradyrhizobium sp. STM 3843]|nr:hypothetical protein BRAS3843_1100090 [Bradyrhizobium sp. STM 3843]
MKIARQEESVAAEWNAGREHKLLRFTQASSDERSDFGKK